MSFSFSVRADTKAMTRHLKALPQVIQKAQVQALNKTGAKINTQTVRATAKAVGVKQKFVRERVYFRGRLKASKNSLEAVILVKHAGISALKLGNVKSQRGRKGVQGGAGIKIGKRRYPHGFVAQMPNGKWMAVQRKGRARLPIEELQVKIVPHVQHAAAAALRTVGAREYPVELDRALKFQLSKIRGKQ